MIAKVNIIIFPYNIHFLETGKLRWDYMKKLKLLSEITLAFQKMQSSNKEINKILDKVRRLIKIDRIRIYLNPWERSIPIEYFWSSEENESYINNLEGLSIENYNFREEMFSKKEYISLDDINSLPEKIRDNLKSQNTKNVIGYPLKINKRISGFITFENFKFKKNWDKDELIIISTLSSLISSELEKKYFKEKGDISEHNYRNFFETIDDMFIVSDIDGNIINCNKTSLDKLGYSFEELTKMNLLGLHPKDKKEKAKLLLDFMLKKERKYCPIPFINKSKEIFPVESRVWIGKWNGEDCIYSISKELTQENERYQLFSKVFENNPLPMSIIDMKENTFSRVNPAFLEKTGYSKKDLYGKAIDKVDLFKETFKIKEATKYRLNGKMKRDEEIEIKRKDGRIMKALFSMENITIQGKESFLMVIVDITEKTEYIKKILDLSNKDSLTDIYNRRYIYKRTEEIIEEYKRDGNEFSVCIIDIDKFKNINDTYGHQIGDCVLKEFTKLINEMIRPYDLLGRYGGEEFILIIKNSNIEKSVSIIERILNYVENKKFVFGCVDANITFSAGISSSCEFKKKDLTIDNLVKNADERMYLAKKSGGNKVIYSC